LPFDLSWLATLLSIHEKAELWSRRIVDNVFAVIDFNALSPASVRAGTTCSFGSNTEFTACSTTFTFNKVGDKTLKPSDGNP
jgi:hypothetical protein